MIRLTISDLLIRNSNLYPERSAFACDGKSITHKELLRRSTQVGNVLKTKGCKPGNRVAIISRNSIEMMEVLCACELMGFIAVPLNHRLATAEIGKILIDCTPNVLIGEQLFESVLTELKTTITSPDGVWLLGPSNDSFGGLAVQINEASPALPEHAPGPDDVAYIIYTSGSTGRPKGVMLSQSALVEAGRLLALPAGLRPDSTQLVVMPMFHVGAVAQRMGYVVAGGKMILHTKFDAELVVDAIGSGEITDIHLAPTMLRSVLDVLKVRPTSMKGLETIKYASSPIPVETLSQAMLYFGSMLIQYYGLTEAGGIVTVLPKFAHADGSRGLNLELLRSAGQAHLGCEIEIRRVDKSVCSVGEEGEIWLRSNAMMTGYWNDPDRTNETVEHGWLRTGDIGKMDGAQYLFVMDRIKDMIVSGGENIYSSEVEHALESHPGVLESAVIGVPDARWGESVHAFVVLNATGKDMTENDLIEYCKTKIASFKKPKSIEFMESLPRLQHVQKIDKQTLRLPFWGNIKRGVN